MQIIPRYRQGFQTLKLAIKIILILVILSPLVCGTNCTITYCNDSVNGPINFRDVIFCKHPQGVFLCGSEHGYLSGKGARWETIKEKIKDYPDNDTLYLALIDNYEWLTKHENYDWSNDANYCYIDYRNKKLGLPNIMVKGVCILTGSDWLFFAILLFWLLVFDFLSRFFNRVFNDPLCSNQSVRLGFILGFVLLSLSISTVAYFGWDKIWDFFSFISSGYGRRPSYTILLSILVIVLFSLHIRRRYLKENAKKLGFWRSFWLSAAIFFSAPIKDKKDEGQNKSDKMINEEMGPLAVIGRALGWILLAIFIATLSNVIIIRSGLS